MKQFPIIILHGWGLSGARFDGLSKVFKNLGYRVYTPDLPGFGQSQIPEKPLHLRDYAVFLKQYLQENRLGPVVLLGHSFGGRVSIKFQELYPKDVRAIILSGTPGFVPVNRIKLMVAIFAAKIGKLPFLLPGLSKFEERARLLAYRMVGAKDYLRATDSMRQTFKNIVRERLDSGMKKITVPTLLLWGSEDQIVKIAIARKMARTIPHAKFLAVTSAKHSYPYDNPVDFAGQADEFLCHL